MEPSDFFGVSTAWIGIPWAWDPRYTPKTRWQTETPKLIRNWQTAPTCGDRHSLGKLTPNHHDVICHTTRKFAEKICNTFGMTLRNSEYFARHVASRMAALGLTQAALRERGGPSDTTLRKILEGAPVGLTVSTLIKFDQSLEWEKGSAARTLAGGDPKPIEQNLAFLHRTLPQLPRNAPNAPVSGAVDAALGLHPFATDQMLPMSATERQLLTRLRNKLFHSEAGALTEEETEVLTRFIEDDELRTLHVRIDWLPRAEQLEVSALVNELQMALEARWVADGYNNESERLPDYAQPNPLPVYGRAPDPADFPQQVPNYLTKEKKYGVETETQSDAQAQVEQDEEDRLDLAARNVKKTPKPE